jgi:type III pantothenate kinase
MLLAADIGNTNVHLGLFEGDRLVATAKFAGDRVTELDEEWARFRGAGAGDPIEGAVVCSVNPKSKIPFCHWVARRFGARPKVVGEDLRLPIELRVDAKDEVGADRIVNAFAAWRLLGPGEAEGPAGAPIVIADFGTAITLDVVSGRGEYLGGAIAPGFQTAARALSSQTALLPYVKVTPADHAIGRNTIDAMRAGLYFGLIGLVDALCERVAAELPRPPRWLATGGDAPMVAERSRFLRDVRPNLTLDGLRLGWEAAR